MSEQVQGNLYSSARASSVSEPSAWMARALALAAEAVGRTNPNPPVGAVLVRDGVVVSEGSTAPAGGPHAEAGALAAAGPAATGATLYVTLEPCGHHGRTPPCADAIIAAGVARVVVATMDPNPVVNGRGLRRLQEAGVAVTLGDGLLVARAMLAPFACHVQTGRPLVTAKYAMTLDGRIATREGDSRWVSGPAARRMVHQWRDRHDAILVGAGTVRIDDPLLTARPSDSLPRDRAPRQPLRIVLAGNRGVAPSSRVLDPSLPGRTMLVVPEDATVEAMRMARESGAELMVSPAAGTGIVDLHALLDDLGARGIMSILVEGGAKTFGSFFDQRLVDRVAAFIAPKIVGGADAPGPIGGTGVSRMAEALSMVEPSFARVDNDLLVEGWLRDPWRTLDAHNFVERHPSLTALGGV